MEDPEARSFKLRPASDQGRKEEDTGRRLQKILPELQASKLQPQHDQARMFNKSRQQRIGQDSTHKGSLAGLLDEEGMLLSIGRIVRIQNGIVHVTTAAEEVPRIVELGAVILSSRFDEVGYEP